MKKFNEYVESYDDNRTGFRKAKREDDEYHTPDPVKHTYKYTVSKEDGEKHERVVTTPPTTRAKHDLEHLARKHLKKQGYKIHEEIAICSECLQAPCACDDSHGFVAEGADADKHHAEAEEHLSKANDADAKGDKKSFHAHMSNHHDAMSEWHDSKSRSASADRHAEKADYHHEKSLTVNEVKMTAAMKLQLAFQREQEKSEASRKRAQELLNPAKKEEPKKVSEGVKSPGVGWMLKKDPKLKDIVDKHKEKDEGF